MVRRKEEEKSIPEARTNQVINFFLNRIERLLTGEEEKAVMIASFAVNLEDDSQSCMMPEEIQLDNKLLSVTERQWKDSVINALLGLGYAPDLLINKFLLELNKPEGWIEGQEISLDREGKVGIKTRIKEKIYPIEPDKLCGRFRDLGVVGEYEIALVSRHTIPVIRKGADEKAIKQLEERESWQILLRRKPD